PRDRVRQDRRDPRHGHRVQHHRQDRRRGARAARRVPLPVQALKRDPMAKLALVLRQQKRVKTVAKYKARRTLLLEIIYDVRASDEAKEEARLKLQKLPRDSAPVRLRNRCALTGRPRGVYSKFGLGRNKLRDLALKGEGPGIIKASWKESQGRKELYK